MFFLALVGYNIPCALLPSVHQQQEFAQYKQNKDPLMKTLLYSATSGPKLHRVPLILNNSTVKTLDIRHEQDFENVS